MILNFSFFLPTTYMIDEMLIVQLLAPMMTINHHHHHHHHCHGNENYQTDGCTDVEEMTLMTMVILLILTTKQRDEVLMVQ